MYKKKMSADDQITITSRIFNCIQVPLMYISWINYFEILWILFLFLSSKEKNENADSLFAFIYTNAYMHLHHHSCWSNSNKRPADLLFSLDGVVFHNIYRTCFYRKRSTTFDRNQSILDELYFVFVHRFLKYLVLYRIIFVRFFLE